jgi:CMP-N,N'-diacetyllegionaminic acid synthase
MMKSKVKSRFLIVVPARGGSKGVPRKNLREVGGRPLIEWSIISGQESNYLKSVVVSTDDDKIAHVARRSGALVVKRPAELATDNSQTELTLAHTLNSIPDVDTFSHIVLLQPTAPIRRVGLVDQAIEKMLSDGSDSLVGVIESSPFIWRGSTDNAVAQYDVAQRPMRQSFKEKERTYRETGNIYITSVQAFKSSGLRVSGVTSLFVLQLIEGLDIDTESDITLANQFLAKYPIFV